MVGYDEPGFIRNCSQAIGADAQTTLFQTAPKIKTTHSHEYQLPKTSLPQQVFHPLLPFSAENFSPFTVSSSFLHQRFSPLTLSPEPSFLPSTEKHRGGGIMFSASSDEIHFYKLLSKFFAHDRYWLQSYLLLMILPSCLRYPEFIPKSLPLRIKRSLLSPVLF